MMGVPAPGKSTMLLLLSLACALPTPDDTGAPDTADTDTADADTADTGGTDSGDTGVPVDTGAWPSTGLPACDERDRDTAGTLPDCVETLSWTRGCDRAPGTLTRAGLLWEGTTAELDLGGSTLTITDAESWDALVAAWPDDAGPAVSVDFATHVVVIVQDDQTSTCGLRIVSHGVYLPEEGNPRVYARFHDGYGACVWQCDMVQQAVVVYAVPRAGGWPIVCSEEILTCD